MKYLFFIVLFFGACTTIPVSTSIDEYNEERVARQAKKLGMRPVDYLHHTNNNKPTPRFFWQAYDANWDDPTINPIFLTKAEAEEYAKRNNMGGLVAGDNSHSYEVREVNYRYEVRIGFSDYTYSNGTWKDAIFTSLSLKESEKYLKEHKAYDTDLIIYDLKTGLIVNE